MIEAVLIISRLGLLRFLKIYTEDENKLNKEEMVKSVYQSIRDSKETGIVFDFEYMGEKRKIIFRLYGTIYIVFIIDELENELAILDFINVYMTILDSVFKDVTELHIILNPDKMYLLIDEMISAGVVIETNKNEILANYTDKLKDEDNYKFFQNK
jgi:hypothetical protein